MPFCTTFSGILGPSVLFGLVLTSTYCVNHDARNGATSNCTKNSSSNERKVSTSVGLNCSQLFWHSFLDSVESMSNQEAQLVELVNVSSSAISHEEKVTEAKVMANWVAPSFNFTTSNCTAEDGGRLVFNRDVLKNASAIFGLSPATVNQYIQGTLESFSKAFTATFRVVPNKTSEIGELVLIWLKNATDVAYQRKVEPDRSH